MSVIRPCRTFAFPPTAGFIGPIRPSPPPRRHLSNGTSAEGLVWLHEIKHDGYRLAAILDGTGGLKLISRNGNDRTPCFARRSVGCFRPAVS
jgi:hypothetical protein